MFKKWLAWYPVYLSNNDYVKIDGDNRWVWMKIIYRRRIYIHVGGMYPLISYNVYKDKI